MEGLASLIDSTNENLLVLICQGDLNTLLHLPSWDLISELLHQKLHYIITLGMDDQSSEPIKRCLLQVADDKTTSVLGTRLRHAIGR